ncbi:MAG: hypothetical protein GX276_07385 [Clostridiaceae bacterium]|jgi:Tfp pilus assembly protein PilX|nr:hypothetical protein [Clostridiaceae bacterium]
MNNKGSTLIILVIVIALVIVLGLSVINTTVNHYEIKKFSIDSKESFYISETGINEAYVRTCDLINESIEAAMQTAEDYLSVDPSDKAEAENIFTVNYMMQISSSIDDSIETRTNPSVKIWNENLAFADNTLTVILKSSYINENKVYQITGAEVVISVPDYEEVSAGSYDVRNYIKIQNWNS